MLAASPAPRPYIAWHYVLCANDVNRNHGEGRRFRSKRGEPLDELGTIKAALKRDGEVISE